MTKIYTSSDQSNKSFNLGPSQEPCTWHEAHCYDRIPPRMRYDDVDAYFKVFDKVFGDRDELHPGEFDQSEEYFNRLYKREVRKRKMLKFLVF